MSDLATITYADPVPAAATLRLNRPEARNALSIDLLEAMHARIDELAARMAGDGAGGGGETPHIVVLTGAGRAFCAGMDLKQVLGATARKDGGEGGQGGTPKQLLSLLSSFTLKLRALPAVTIAAVHGAAIGGGCGLATVCDVAVTHADSKMGFPEVDMGVCPAVVAPWLVRKIGAGPARAVLLRGGLMSGGEALGAGIVDHCADTRDMLDAFTASLAEKFATGGPRALAATKDLLNRLDGSLDPAIAQRAADLSASVLETPEARAMLKAKLGLA